MKKRIIPLILVVFVVGFVGFLTAGCSSSDDDSTLEFYVTGIDPVAGYYQVGSSSGIAATFTVECRYNGDSSLAPTGMFVKKITFSAQTEEGTAISGVTDQVLVTGQYLDVGTSLSIVMGDILWSSLYTWLDAQSPTGTESMVIKIYVQGEDTAGNALNTSTYFSVLYY